MASRSAPRLQCPNCGHPLNPETPETEIQADDYTICKTCGMLLLYRADLTLRYPTPQDLDALDPEMIVELAQAQQEVFAQLGQEAFGPIRDAFDRSKTAGWN